VDPIKPYWDPAIESMVIKKTENWIVSVTPMIFNDRICLTHREKDYPYGYTAGFCYDKGPAAHLAALVWDPETEFEPVGHKKVACDSRERPKHLTPPSANGYGEDMTDT
jgi:hypothetical protein